MGIFVFLIYGRELRSGTRRASRAGYARLPMPVTKDRQSPVSREGFGKSHERGDMEVRLFLQGQHGDEVLKRTSRYRSMPK